MGISDQFTVSPGSRIINETDHDIDGTVVPLRNQRSRDRSMVKIDSGEFKADRGEDDDTTASEIGDSEIEARHRLRSATTSVLAPDNHEYEWGVRRIIGKNVVGEHRQRFTSKHS